MGLTTLRHVNNWKGETFEEAAPSHEVELSPDRLWFIGACNFCDRVVIRGAGRWWESPLIRAAVYALVEVKS